LHRLSQAQISKAVFPVGELKKSQVREIAARAGLPNHAKKDSTGICFIGERPFREFLQRYLPRQPGPMQTPEGKRVGEHQGLMYYTIGQRQGLGIGGTKTGDGTPWFVVDKVIASNTLIVAQGHDHPMLLKPSLSADDASWISGAPPETGRHFGAKTRYRQTDAACTFNASEGSGFSLSFEQPQWAITPGQSAVLYDGEVCLGGGVIR
jgi:tRNA-specific 2-thiouridylase